MTAYIDHRIYYAHCEMCGSQGPLADSKQKAKRLWNTRSYKAPVIKGLIGGSLIDDGMSGYCASCENELDYTQIYDDEIMFCPYCGMNLYPFELEEEEK